MHEFINLFNILLKKIASLFPDSNKFHLGPCDFTCSPWLLCKTIHFPGFLGFQGSIQTMLKLRNMLESCNFKYVNVWFRILNFQKFSLLEQKSGLKRNQDHWPAARVCTTKTRIFKFTFFWWFLWCSKTYGPTNQEDKICLNKNKSKEISLFPGLAVFKLRVSSKSFSVGINCKWVL